MDKAFIPANFEEKLYQSWEKKIGQKTGKNKSFTILMPPPNANASLHAGHGMYTVDDILIRYKKIMGYDCVWIPGLDHAGFETQFVYEKYLAKQDKSRMDFDRQTLYNDIFKFVQTNSGLIYGQLKRLGFLANWERGVFMLDNHVLQTVFETFKKMHSEGLIYRSDYIVNYCSHCGTSLSELETLYEEKNDPLYYIQYGPFVLATVRPETKFGDTAIAVNPKDKRYQKWIGKEIEAEDLLGKIKLRVISDEYVDPNFGTGVVKVTPAHDNNDYLMGKRHNLEIKRVIDLNGRLTSLSGPYAGLKVKVAREKIVVDLKSRGLLVKVDEKYVHNVTVCYKCKRNLEPTIISNWFIKVENLKKPVIEAVEKEETKFFPIKFKKQILDWLAVMHDWPISRQIAWGIRIPAWYELKLNPEIFIIFLDKNKQQIQGKAKELLDKYSFSEIENGLQKLVVPIGAKYIISESKPTGFYLQETDTFDTWFSSSQWPVVTLKSDEYNSRFPTDFIGTLSDILPFWISRMMMFSLYLKKKVPFKNVYLWSMVADAKGVKMSKSKGNVINPIDLVNKYGADAFRASLFFGTAEASKVNLAEDKVRAMRNYANKIWNIGRFLLMNKDQLNSVLHNNINIKSQDNKTINETTKLKKEFEILEKITHQQMEEFQFSRVFDGLYEFLWHRFADYYLEVLKDDLKNGNIETLKVLEDVYFKTIKLLHPFMPFVTEAIYQSFFGNEKSLLNNEL